MFTGVFFMRKKIMSVNGNSFVLTIEPPSSKCALTLCSRFKTDGTAFLKKQGDSYGYLLFNSDGSRAAFCGNATMCVARYLFDERSADASSFYVGTDSGPRKVEIFKEEHGVRVELYLPEPCERAVRGYDQTNGRLVYRTDEGEKILKARSVCTGNEHLVVFDVSRERDDEVRSSLANSGLFTGGVNIEFVERATNGLKVRVYERGCGRTSACGSGAAAVAFAARKEGLIGDKTVVFFEGGETFVELRRGVTVLSAYPVYGKGENLR